MRKTVATEKALKDIMSGIEDRHHRMKRKTEVWFWPKRNGVKGFLGTAPIMIVGLNPSMGGHSKTTGAVDTFFYKTLRNEGLVSAHVTDLIKIRAIRSDVPLLFHNPNTLGRHKRYFKKEVAILQPSVIVTMGRMVWDVLRAWGFIQPKGDKQFIFRLPQGGEAQVIPTVHPAATRYRQRTIERRKRFRRDLMKARLLLKALRG